MNARSITHGAARPEIYPWIVVALLWFVALLNYFDRLMIASMREPIRADVPMSDAHFGLLTSVFLLVYGICSPLGGFLADRLGRRGIIIASLLFWSLATYLTGLAHSFNQMIGARALMGISEACYIPAALAMVVDYHRGRHRSLATGLHMTGLYAGTALGGAGGYIAEHFGWRAGFRAMGAVGIGYTLLLIFTLFDAPRARSPERPAADDTELSMGNVLRSLIKLPAFRLLLLLNVLVGMVQWVIYGWLPTYMRENFGLSLGAAGLSATGYIQAASLVGVLVGGVVADRWRNAPGRSRALVPAIALLLAGPCLLVAASTIWLAVAVCGLIVFGLSRGALDCNQMPILRELADPRYSATGYGLLNLIGCLAGGVMVYLGGALKDAHIELSRVFQAGSAMLVLSGFILLALHVFSLRKRGQDIAESVALV